ncbi:MAG: DUF3631 domain-containing protein [bacterium]|nr:DUF3631 domain-containing protein [bacterium]
MMTAATVAQADPSVHVAPLLDAIDDLVAMYVVMGAAERTAVALWVAHCFVLDAFDVSPYLNVRSAEKRSGKTRLLEVLGELVPRRWHAIQPTEAVLFRKIERDTPTLLLDEVDAIFKGPASERTEGLRAVLNSGYRRGVTVDRCVGKDKDRLASFHTFCPKVLAGIGTLPDTVADRSIPIVLSRRKKGEAVARFRLRDVTPQGAAIHTALEAWAATAVEPLRAMMGNVVMPEVLGDRAAEVWEPLVAVAELAGGDWPSRARAAAVDLNGAAPDVESTGVQLLAAVAAIFAARKTDRLFSVELLDGLIGREGEPWGSWWGQDVDRRNIRGPGYKLSRLLKPYDIAPKSIRVGTEHGSGYERTQFSDAFARYLAERSDNVTTVVPQGFEASGLGAGGNHVLTHEVQGALGLSGRQVVETVSTGSATETPCREPGEEG